MSSSEENVDKMRSSCGISVNSTCNNYNNGDQVQVCSTELSHLNHHHHFNVRQQLEGVSSSSPATIQAITTTMSSDPSRGTSTAPRQYTETPDIFKELPKLSNTLNNCSNFIRQMDTNSLTGNVHPAIDHSTSIDSTVKEIVPSTTNHPPHPPPLPLLPSSSSISSSTYSDNTLTCGSSFSSDNNCHHPDHHLVIHPLSYGLHQQQPQIDYGIPVGIDGSGHGCHRYSCQDADVNYMTSGGQRLSQVTMNNSNLSHCTMRRGGGGGCLSSSCSTAARGGNFTRSYSSSSQLSSSDYGSTATGPTCPNLSIYSPLSVYTESIESKCLDNNYLESKFTENGGRLSPIETILNPNQYQLAPSTHSSHGSHYSLSRHSIYGDTIYPSHEHRNQFSDQNTILDSYATIQRMKEPSLILSPRVVLTSEENETWNQVGNTTSSDTIQQQYLKHKSNIEKQCAKDSEKIKAKMGHKSSSTFGLYSSDGKITKRRGKRRKCFQNESSSSWIVHLLASCPFICFLVQRRGKRRHKVLASFPGEREGRTEMEEGKDSCSLTVLDKSGRKPFGREMTGNEIHDDNEEVEEECFDLSPSNCNFSPSAVKCLERRKRISVGDGNMKKDIEYLEVKQTEDGSINFPPNNLTANFPSSSDDRSDDRSADDVEATLYTCKSKRSSTSSCRTFHRLSIFLLISLLVLLMLNYLVPTFNIYGLFPSIHSSSASDHYGDVNGGLNPSERWWKEGIFYEIFPPSFKDSNSDGFGDLNGIREKLSYLKSDLGVTGIRLNSIFRALDYPFQYDHVVDFKSVDPHIGTLEDFVQLVNEAHEMNLAILLDINPVMTSDQHPWATQWLLNKSLSAGDFSSFYAPNPKNDKPLDVTSSTAIDRESVRDLEEMHISFGGHLYLNWSSPGVQSNMMQVFDFWLNLGVDGFYLKNLHLMQVNSPETILDILHNLKHLLLSRSSLSDRERSSLHLSSSSHDPEDVRRREKRETALNSVEKSLNPDGEVEMVMLRNFSVEIEKGFDEGLEGRRNISHSNHSSFLSRDEEKEGNKNVGYDTGDLDLRTMQDGRRKVVKRRSGNGEKQRVSGHEKGKEMPSRILMASKYSLDLLSDQIRKHSELKYFSSLRIPFPKHTLHPTLKVENEKVGGQDEKGKGNRKGMKSGKFDGKQKKEGNVRHEGEGVLEVEPDLNSMKDQRKKEEEEVAGKGRENKRKKDEKVGVRGKRRKREGKEGEVDGKSSNQAEMDEDVSTHNNILQAIPGRIDDHQGIHLEFYGNKSMKQGAEGNKTVGSGTSEEGEKYVTEYAQRMFNERRGTGFKAENGSETYNNQHQMDANDDDLNILDQVLMRQSLSEMNEMQSDDGSHGTRGNTMKSNDRNKNSILGTTAADMRTAHKSIYSYFDLVDIYLDIQLNQTENIRDQINSVYINEPLSHPWVNWNIGSTVTSRLATRLGSNITLTSMFLLFMLPGSVTIFYGDELALKNSISSASYKEYRGGQLVPMSWSPSIPFGNFTNNKTASSSPSSLTSGQNTVQHPWIPMNFDCITNNVQLKQGSSIKTLSSLISFRKTYFKQEGTFYNNNHNYQPIEKRGNYLFHYIHDGELVLERYFSRKQKQASPSSFSSTSSQKRKRRRRWNSNNHGHRKERDEEDEKGWKGREKRESANNKNSINNRTISNKFPSTSSPLRRGGIKLCSNSSNECSLSNGSSTTIHDSNNNLDSTTIMRTRMELANNDRGNYNFQPPHFSSSLNSSASLTKQLLFPLPSVSAYKGDGKIGHESRRKLIAQVRERNLRRANKEKNGSENEVDKMKSVISTRNEDTSASSIPSTAIFPTKSKRKEVKKERTRNQTGIIIGPRKSEMIEKEAVKGRSKRSRKVQQMMMTKTRGVGIEEEKTRKGTEEAIKMSKRNDMKENGRKEMLERGEKVVAEVGLNNTSKEDEEMYSESKERFDLRQVIWDREEKMQALDGDKGDDTSGQEDDDDNVTSNNKSRSSGNHIEKEKTMEGRLKTRADGGKKSSQRADQEQVEDGDESEDDGDEVVIATMVELPKVALQHQQRIEDEEYYDENNERKAEEIEEALLNLEVGERKEEDEGQRSTIIEPSLSRSLVPFPSSTLFPFSPFGSSISSPLSSSSLSSDTDEDGETVVRSRFVLFANLASSTVRIKDLRDKFHSGSIKVTSNPRRIRDFLYFRSLKLDPGEALIAQVE